MNENVDKNSLERILSQYNIYLYNCLIQRFPKGNYDHESNYLKNEITNPRRYRMVAIRQNLALE